MLRSQVSGLLVKGPIVRLALAWKHPSLSLGGLAVAATAGVVQAETLSRLEPRPWPKFCLSTPGQALSSSHWAQLVEKTAHDQCFLFLLKLKNSFKVTYLHSLKNKLTMQLQKKGFFVLNPSFLSKGNTVVRLVWKFSEHFLRTATYL